MTRTDKLMVGIISLFILIIFAIQIGIHEGRKLEREEIKRENQEIINFFGDRVKKLQSEVKEKEKLLEKKKGIFVATAYCNSPVCINIPKWRDGKTASGTEVRVGVIAVDPAVIPLGSEVYLEKYGWFKAEDVGGKIKGKRIDIFLGSFEKAKEFGKKEVVVYY